MTDLQRSITKLCSFPLNLLFIYLFIFQLMLLVFYCCGFSLTAFISIVSKRKMQLFRSKSFDKTTVHYLPSTKHTADKVRNQLVNIQEHLAAKEPHISIRSCWRPKQSSQKKEDWASLEFIWWPEARLQINASAALCLLYM